ncbi:conserved exported protein of unknown function [Georgfuchsia toluolica]|uniref:DUF1329 domain-containing protein n=1 Tax=Georgfuchsia toluolica TaxID=424218 RepID=A0A916N3J5_9PROT|nr:DUF1329 domain-containing protein [Georgfuchsia toluolica]CAG4885131.1 conserved exported protein of unknown function [Georgfuchsia toluolica]
MKFKLVLGTLMAAGLTTLLAHPSFAAVTAEEAKQLGTTLTEFGAEKAGNKDGSIPAYTGGLAKLPNYDREKMKNYLDPYKDEKPLYSVTAQNMAQYDAVLTAGNKALLTRYPGYRIDVYQTHRSVRYQPWIIQNTLKNATTAKLAGEIEGDAVAGADKKNLPFPGVFFPIPKNGYEVMWNHKMHNKPAVNDEIANAYLVDTAGGVSSMSVPHQTFVAPWYDVKGKLRGEAYDSILGFHALQTAPPSAAGIVFLNFYLATAENNGQRVWFYTPGQRRVRAAPEFAYDVPIAAYGGAILWDEIFGFVGRLDRFDFKLVGKKEMLVPYNMFAMTNTMTKKEDYLGPKFVKPEAMRYEKHRVWVVDATRKANARHVYSRRTFYIDEDCWCLVAQETYDNAGKIYRVILDTPVPTYDIGGVNDFGWITYDLIKGNYFTTNMTGEPVGMMRSYDTMEGMNIPLTPAGVAAASVR